MKNTFHTIVKSAGLASLLGLSLQAIAVEVPKEKENFHIFVLAGQSNMSGRGTLTANNRVSHERVLSMDRDGKWRDAVEPIHQGVVHK